MSWRCCLFSLYVFRDDVFGQEHVALRVKESLERVETTAIEEIHGLHLPDATSREVVMCLQSAFENERRKYDPSSPCVKSTGPVYALRFRHHCQ